jgi:hypothetical protein
MPAPAHGDLDPARAGEVDRGDDVRRPLAQDDETGTVGIHPAERRAHLVVAGVAGTECLPAQHHAELGELLLGDLREDGSGCGHDVLLSSPRSAVAA